MSPIFTRRLKYFLRLEYPRRVCFDGRRFRGWFPDLPAIAVEDTDIERLYARLDEQRQQFIAAELERGRTIPMPNSGGKVAPEPKPASTSISA